MEVFLDTNFIAAALEARVRVREELGRNGGGKVEFLVLSSVLEEVEKLPAKEKSEAKLFLKSEEFEVVEAKGDVDRSLAKEAKTRSAAVATLDSGLKKRLKSLGVQVITLSKNRLVLV
ncbi:hypothetical protein HZC09_03150 [Candidatus Micrarchaeota archaeon]|nr:hypothetical protein [Candidatus Micrarchaeota archaeon]